MFIYTGDSQRGVLLLSRVHLAVPGAIFGCHNWEVVLLTSSEYRLLHILHCAGQSPRGMSLMPRLRSAETATNKDQISRIGVCGVPGITNDSAFISFWYNLRSPYRLLSLWGLGPLHVLIFCCFPFIGWTAQSVLEEEAKLKLALKIPPMVCSPRSIS